MGICTWKSTGYVRMSSSTVVVVCSSTLRDGYLESLVEFLYFLEFRMRSVQEDP